MPEIFIQHKQQNLAFACTLAEPVPAGHCLRLRADGVVALRAFDRITVLINGQPCPQIQRFDPEAMKQDFGWFCRQLPVVTVSVQEDLGRGDSVDIEAVVRGFASDGHGGGPTQAPNPYAGVRWKYALFSASSPDADVKAWRPISDEVPFRLVAGPPAGLEALLRPGGRLSLQTFDAFMNPVCPSKQVAEVDGEPVRLNSDRPVTTITCDRERVGIRDLNGTRRYSSAQPKGLHGTPVYFGEFHWHTEFSGDGQRPMDEALRSARDELCLDFAGPSDHLGRGVRFKERTLDDHRTVCEAFNEPGRFVTLPTYERSEREGHVNVIADSWETLRAVAEATDHKRYPKHGFPWQEIVQACPNGQAMIVPHHPNMDSHVREGVVNPHDGRPFWCRMDWGPRPEHAVTRLVEMHQSRGCFESEDPNATWQVISGGFGSSVQTALARGFRLGFTAGTDNHSGWPTRCPSGWCGMTGVVAGELTLPSLFEALHARRCYATTGARIVAEYSVNHAPMGSEVVQEPCDPRVFRIKVRGTAPLDRLQIVSCGAVLADLPVEADSPDADREWADERPGRPLRDVYYYVRVRQVDGHCAWLSPVWCDLTG